jgi:hypothetical protein
MCPYCIKEPILKWLGSKTVVSTLVSLYYKQVYKKHSTFYHDGIQAKSM